MTEELRVELLGLGKEVAISAGLFIVGLLFLGANATQAFLIACIPYGWSVLNKITPNIFLWMPVVGWIIYFISKGCIAAFIGVFAFAFKLIKGVLRVVKAYQHQQFQ